MTVVDLSAARTRRCPSPPSPYARELTFRAYATRPSTGDPLDYTCHFIEQQLSSLWEHRLDAAWLVDAWAPEIGTIRAGDLLDALFAAADDAAHAEMIQSGTQRTVEAYEDALHALATAIRDAADAGRCDCNDRKSCGECMATR